MEKISLESLPRQAGAFTTFPAGWLARNPKVFVVLPTYNEASNLPGIVTAIFAQNIPETTIIVVDDSSPDGTGEIAEKLKPAYDGRLMAIHRPEKQGLGKAYLQGFRTALDLGADLIIQMDADFSHSPDYLPQLVEQTDRADVVIGSRYVPGGRLDPRWNWWRIALSVWANSIYVRLILGLQVKDATGGFKCWRREALETVMQQQVSSSGYIFQVEMALLAEKLGFKVKEIPIYFEDRRIGKSKLSGRVKLEAAWRTWYLGWRYRHLPRRQPSPINWQDR